MLIMLLIVIGIKLWIVFEKEIVLGCGEIKDKVKSDKFVILCL